MLSVEQKTAVCELIKQSCGLEFTIRAVDSPPNGVYVQIWTGQDYTQYGIDQHGTIESLGVYRLSR